MRRKLAVGFVVLVSAMALGAAVAPARVTNVKATLSIFTRVIETGTSFQGEVVAPANRYCAQKRNVEIFRDGKKVETAESDRYGKWSGGIAGDGTGTYVAKIKKSHLPAAMQQTPGKAGRIFCKAAQSKPTKVPEESTIG